jgi:phosphoribosylaminoimidazolecarboxamide formyltransferase/IMP cyclohydrolase
MSFNIVQKIDDRVEIRNVLLSVFDKTGLDALVSGLLSACPHVRFYSTGGTYKAVQALLGADAAKRLVSVSDYTGQPEMQGGLVKTLDFKIYLGLLGETYNAAHQADLQRTGAVAFDMVVANLYPFKQVIAQAGVSPEQARTNVDIGGPCMIRAAAKNYIRVASVTDAADYPALIAEAGAHGGSLSFATRLALMKKAFAHTAAYDAAIAAHFAPLDAAQTGAAYSLPCPA